MSTTEIVVTLGGLFFGYWIVSSMLGVKSQKQQNPNRSWTPGGDRKGASQSQSDKDTDYKEQVNQYARSEVPPDPWYKVLEIAENASREEIATAYKLKIRQYHPDKVAALGPELRDLAELKSKQINAAYDFALKLRG